MRIMWMPYLMIDGLRGQASIPIGKSKVYKDSTEVWESVVGIPRPKFLEIFRKFPPFGLASQGDPVKGSIVMSQDAGWLLEYGDEIASILYFLGDSNSKGRPAECFQYHFLDLKQDELGVADERDAVRFYSKHGEKYETSDSIILYPPISVRGNQGSYRLLLDSVPHKNLLAAFESNPMERRVVAVRQYFRTQFSDTFTSTSREDYAGFCSVYESALNIESRYRASERFETELMAKYSPEDNPEYRKFFSGLYVARCVFVHGGSIDELKTSATDDYNNMQYFETRNGKLTALRVISRDLILDSLGAEPNLFPWDDSCSSILAKILTSDEMWKRVSGVLSADKAAQVILSSSDEDFNKVGELLTDMRFGFDWSCVESEINLKCFKKALITCVMVLTKSTNTDDEIFNSSVRLGDIADSLNMNELKEWSLAHEEWNGAYISDFSRVAVMQGIAYRLAEYSHHCEL